eukprot:1955737-Rhodomonas_salina.1
MRERAEGEQGQSIKHSSALPTLHLKFEKREIKEEEERGIDRDIHAWARQAKKEGEGGQGRRTFKYSTHLSTPAIIYKRA